LMGTVEAGKLIQEIHEMDSEFRRLTGREAYQYASEPGDGQVKCVFADTQVRGYAAARNHMQRLLVTAQNNRAALPFPYDQELTAEQDRRGDLAWVRARL
jgi:hypothetical protein